MQRISRRTRPVNREADSFFAELTGESIGGLEEAFDEVEQHVGYEDCGCGNNHDDEVFDEELDELDEEEPSDGAWTEEDRSGYEAEFAAEAVPVDATAAVPPFSATQRSNVVTPLLSSSARAAALRWNNARHSARSGVTMAELRAALAHYVDIPAVATAMGGTVTASSADAVVEAIHQFQTKCFVDAGQIDGKAGGSTLDSLGLIARTGLRPAVRPNAGRAAYLRSKASRIRSLSGGQFDGPTWYDHMINPTFLGRRFSAGVHLHYVRALRVAQRHLLSLSAYAGKTPVELGAALGIAEKHKGARPTSTSKSMHTLGLASDINYLLTPWITNPDNASGTRDFIAVMRRASWLVSGSTAKTDAAYLHGLGSGGRSTGVVYDELKGRSDALKTYLAFATNPTALAAAVAARTGTAPSGSPSTAAGWSRQVAADLRTLQQRGGNFGSHRDPRQGYLGLHRDLVIALRDVACMAWGAIDFGPKYSGDVMHFDVRRTGLGQALNEKGFRTAVPCPGTPSPSGSGS